MGKFSWLIICLILTLIVQGCESSNEAALKQQQARIKYYQQKNNLTLQTKSFKEWKLK